MTRASSEEVAANLERARDALRAARALFDAGFYDAVASRAYYAAFYAVTALLLSHGHAFRKHSAVISTLHRMFVKTGAVDTQHGKWFGWLFELRAVGDYGETTHVPEAAAKTAIERAGTLVDVLSKLCI